MSNKDGAIGRSSISKKIDNINLDQSKAAENKKDTQIQDLNMKMTQLNNELNQTKASL